MQTDDDRYHVNVDLPEIMGAKPGATIHYRLVARNSAGTRRTLARVPPRGRAGPAGYFLRPIRQDSALDTSN